MNFTAWKQSIACLLCVLCAFVVHSSAAGWTTYRGNPQRTGNTDGKPGPEKPKVLWVYKSLEHFIASPVPAGDRLFVSGVGAFNASTFYCLAADDKGDKQKQWTKAAPWLKLATVSAPAIVDGKLVFGDGMHQTDGATVYVWNVDGSDSPNWEYPVPGKLVHLEGSPVVVDKKAYLGGGAAGVICVDLDKLTLNGKPIAAGAVQKELDTQWDALLKKYDIDYKKDPDFTIKPTKDKLSRPTPTKVWQTGEEKWHVDAPVNVVGDKVLVASAFLDKEKVGDRALHCLDAKTGKSNWRAPLLINPWGGPSVLDNVVVVSGSSVAYDPGVLKGAKGELAAFDLETGKELWRKEIKGGVLSCAALADGKAICTATDGKVRAYNLKDGLLAWDYPAKAPLFAPPAVAGDTVYVGDLTGVVHAINLATGTGKWTLNLGTDPAVKLPGMIYGGPVVHNGRIYVGTCTISDMPGTKETANKPTGVICIGQ